MTTTVIETPPGLAGVQVTRTHIGDVRGHEGFYHYRQYNATDLARQHSVEEVWHLLVHGELPTAAQYQPWRDQIAAARAIPTEIGNLLPHLATPGANPLTTLRTALSAWGGQQQLTPLWDSDAAAKQQAALTAAAIVPSLLAASWRLSHGLQPIASRPDLDHATDYLYQLHGELPTDQDAAAIRSYLVSTMDHGFNSSTFTSRVVASTGADLAACLVAAIGSFTGPLHGGAPGRALAAIEEIGHLDRAEEWVRDQLARGHRIMGFGHAIYRGPDPRSELLKELLAGYDSDLTRLAKGVEDVINRVFAETKPDRPLRANVEYYAGVLMSQAGIPAAMASPTFCVARSIGWVANILEQAEGTKIMRPSAKYIGPEPAAQVPPSVS